MNNEELINLINLATVGSKQAAFELSDYYINSGDYQKAFDIIARLESTNDKEVFRRIGYFYQEGKCVTKDLEKALEYYQKASDLDDYLARFNIASIYYSKKEYSKALPYLLDGQVKGHINSIKMLAEFYNKGLAVNQNILIAENLYKRLIELGDYSSYYLLGQISLSDNDFNKAYYYFDLAVKNEDIRAYCDLANAYLLGKGVSKNIEAAIKLLTDGVLKNDLKCTKQLALLYKNGIGVSKDEYKATELMTKIENLEREKHK